MRGSVLDPTNICWVFLASLFMGKCIGRRFSNTLRAVMRDGAHCSISINRLIMTVFSFYHPFFSVPVQLFIQVYSYVFNFAGCIRILLQRQGVSLAFVEKCFA